jgi:toxin-antitoxin system PIN domain toxin
VNTRRARPAPAPTAQDLSGSHLARQPIAPPRISLLDVNVLIALCDGRHEHHTTAAQWFVAHAAQGWASCPLTQNGAIRIMSAPAYPGARPVSQVLAQVQAMCASAHHRFWPDKVSLVQPGTLNPAHLLGHRQLTDAYLLALAVQNQGRFVTLDGAVPVKAVAGARADDVVRLV